MKKRGRHRAKQPRNENRRETTLLHFRLCHVCLYLNESAHEITGCKKCGELFMQTEDHSQDEIHLVSESDTLEDWEEEQPSAPFSASNSAHPHYPIDEEEEFAASLERHSGEMPGEVAGEVVREMEITGLRVRW